MMAQMGRNMEWLHSKVLNMKTSCIDRIVYLLNYVTKYKAK
jgi:hypothetical protein